MAGSRTLYAIYVVAMAGVAVAAVEGFATTEQVAGPAMLIFDIVMVIYGVRACRQPGVGRRFVWTLTAAFILTFVITLTFMVTGTKAFPQVGDALHLFVTIVLFVALMLVPVLRATRRERWKTLLDAGTVALGASMLFWYFVVGPALEGHHHSWRLILAAACYPLVDLLVLFGFARVLLRGTRHVSRRILAMLGGAVVSLFAGDVYLGYTQAHVAVVQRSTFEFVCWTTTHLLLACGAVELWRQAAQPADTTRVARRGMAGKLPYLGIGVGYALLAFAAVRQEGFFPWDGLVLGSIGITTLVVLRQVLVQQETSEAAETDPLTGLVNRARLHDELDRALHRAIRTGQSVAVLLIDLNGFKQVNDSLGHQAGDGLLVAVARAMRDCVRAEDVVGRLGGDEFAVVLRSHGDEATAGSVARRITEAIAGPFVVGERPLSASASIGIAVSEAGAVEADALLHRADVAMYDVKRAGSGWQAWPSDPCNKPASSTY